jgi:tRNA pseudouridine55 synthase
MFSAVKVEGKPLYKYARKGEEVRREPRAVHVYTLELLKVQPPIATLRCVCSGGTYVRTIAHELGKLVGCGGHVTALARTAVGRFTVEQARPPDEVGPEDLVPPEEALDPMPVMRLKDGQLQVLQHGNFLRVANAPNEGLAAVTDEDGSFVCVARVLENELHPECVLPIVEPNGTVR